jgi:hypothetical protein
MRIREGRGYLLRTGEDGPYAGWVGIRQLDLGGAIPSAPWEALRNLADLARLLPGGLALLWNAPVAWITGLAPEVRAGVWKGLGHMPGLTLHLRDEAFGPLLQEPIQAWLHASRPPTGAQGLAWRQGWLGWVPGPDTGPWSLPGLGTPETADGDDFQAGFLWGELTLPLGALDHVQPADLAAALAEAQARSEQAMSQRIGAGAWPAAFPFQRRRTGWRVALLGGREYQLAGGSWERAALLAGELKAHLEQTLRCPIHLAVSGDPVAAAALGQQAMWEDHPWRNALPLPPAPPSFTPGLGADPRDPAPVAARCAFPEPLAAVLSELPAVLLRVPAVPMEGAVHAFLSGLREIPAIRWLPPELPAPGPFQPDHPWAPAGSCPPLADTTQVLQPSLFDDLV